MWQADFAAAAAAVMSPPIRRQSVDGTALKGGLASGVLGPLGTDHCAFNSTQKARRGTVCVHCALCASHNIRFALRLLNTPQAAGRHDFRLIPNGVNGIGERMVLAWDALVASGLASPMDFVRATSTAAAQAFNIFPRKGVIAVGSDADVVLFDPKGSTTIRRVAGCGLSLVPPLTGRLTRKRSAKTHFSASDTNVYEGRTAVGRVTHTVSRGRLVWADGTLTCEPGTARYVPAPPFSPWLFAGIDAQDAARRAARAPVQRGAEKHDEL